MLAVAIANASIYLAKVSTSLMSESIIFSRLAIVEDGDAIGAGDVDALRRVGGSDQSIAAGLPFTYQRHLLPGHRFQQCTLSKSSSLSPLRAGRFGSSQQLPRNMLFPLNSRTQLGQVALARDPHQPSIGLLRSTNK